jgi:hypothetical protein
LIDGVERLVELPDLLVLDKLQQLLCLVGWEMSGVDRDLMWLIYSRRYIPL